MLSVLARNVVRTSKRIVASGSSFRFYSYEDSITGRPDKYEHYNNMEIDDLNKYDRFNYNQPIVISDGRHNDQAHLLWTPTLGKLKISGIAYHNPTADFLIHTLRSHKNSENNIVIQNPFADPSTVVKDNDTPEDCVGGIRQYLSKSPILYVQDCTMNSFLKDEIDLRIYTEDPVTAFVMKNMTIRSPLFPKHITPSISIYIATGYSKPCIYTRMNENKASIVVGGNVNYSTILDTIADMCNEVYTYGTITELPKEATANQPEKVVPPIAKISAFDRHIKKIDNQFEGSEKLLSKYVLRSDIIRSPDGVACAVVGMNREMREKAYEKKALFSANHTVFYNEGMSRLWGGLALPHKLFSPLSPSICVNDILYRGMTADPISKYPSSFIIIDNNVKQMREYNSQQLHHYLAEEGYDMKGIKFIEKLFRYHKTESFVANPDIIHEAIDYIDTIPLKEVEKE
ncbi:hypothetical protein WA158_004314 [Blastocystis sp. Blastoise]